MQKLIPQIQLRIQILYFQFSDTLVCSLFSLFESHLWRGVTLGPLIAVASLLLGGQRMARAALDTRWSHVNNVRAVIHYLSLDTCLLEY